MKLNRSLRGMMCAESSDRFIGHRLGRLSQSAIGGEAHWLPTRRAREHSVNRGRTFGPFDAALEGLARVCAHLNGPIYVVSRALGRVQVKLNKSLESGLALLISINDTP